MSKLIFMSFMPRLMKIQNMKKCFLITYASLCFPCPAHTHIPSVEKASYTISTHSNEVPVSVVDMDVPVTAIDEVLEDFEHNTVEKSSKELTMTESRGSKGMNNNTRLS